MKNSTIKPAMIALSLTAAILFTNSALAYRVVSLPSKEIIGFTPYIKKIGVYSQDNTFKVGTRLIVPELKNKGTGTFEFVDKDGDEKTSDGTFTGGGESSSQTAVWYIVPAGTQTAEEFERLITRRADLDATSADLTGLKVQFGEGASAIVPNLAQGHQIALVITPQTFVGYPSQGVPLIIPDITKLAGQTVQDPNNTRPTDVPFVDPTVTESNPSFPGESNLIPMLEEVQMIVFEQKDFEAKGINATPINFTTAINTVNTTYVARVINTKEKKDITDLYDKVGDGIKWTLIGVGTVVDDLTSTGRIKDYSFGGKTIKNGQFTTQAQNKDASSQAKITTERSEQGLRIQASFDNGK